MTFLPNQRKILIVIFSTELFSINLFASQVKPVSVSRSQQHTHHQRLTNVLMHSLISVKSWRLSKDKLKFIELYSCWQRKQSNFIRNIYCMWILKLHVQLKCLGMNNICDSTHENVPVESEVQTWRCYLLIGCSFSLSILA